MKPAKDNRKKVIFVVVLFGGALLLFLRALMGFNPSAVPPPVAPRSSDFELATATAPASPAAAPGKRTKAPLPSLDPRLRLNLLAESEQVEYKGSGRNIFDRTSAPEIEKPLANGAKKPAPAPPPPPPVASGPPPPPPIDLKFFGFANSTGAPRQVFLAKGDDIFVAKEGDIVNRRYKVVRVLPNSVEIEDVLTNSRQTIPLTQG